MQSAPLHAAISPPPAAAATAATAAAAAAAAAAAKRELSTSLGRLDLPALQANNHFIPSTCIASCPIISLTLLPPLPAIRPEF